MQPSLGTGQNQQPQQQAQQLPPQQQATFQQQPTQLQEQGFPSQEQALQPPQYDQGMQPGYQQSQDFSQYPDASQGYQDSYPEYQPPQATDVETINDISSQIIEEKTKLFKQEISSLVIFKKEMEDKIKNMNDRLTKIEDNIENLHMAIIRKIGEYGEDIKNISKEMKATQSSFSKIIDPITDHKRSKKSSKSKSKSRKSTSFEDYLR